MLLAPISETKTTTAQSKSQLAPQSGLELHPHAFGVVGTYALNGTRSVTSGHSPEAQRRQTLAGMQSTHGNQAVLRMLHSPQQVARMAPLCSGQGVMLQRKCACGGSSGSTGECTECKAEREATLQGHAVNANAAPAGAQGVPSIVHDVLHSPGQLLDAGTRAFMEPRFGHDFSQVRVHTDAKAAESARAVNALAYTVGRNMVFGAGQYAPGTSEGRWLMAHELTHVVQQGQASTVDKYRMNSLVVGSPSDLFEQEANLQASKVIEGYPKPISQLQEQAEIARIQRQTSKIDDKVDVSLDMTCNDAQPTDAPSDGVALENFERDSHSLKSEYEKPISEFVAAWKTHDPHTPVEVHGYASVEGSIAHNKQLSCDRANAIVLELIHRGVTSEIRMFSHGETEKFGLGIPNYSKNRRVIIRTTSSPQPQPQPVPPSPSGMKGTVQTISGIPGVTLFDGQRPFRIEVTAVPVGCDALQWEQFVGGYWIIRDHQGNVIMQDACEFIRAHINKKSKQYGELCDDISKDMEPGPKSVNTKKAYTGCLGEPPNVTYVSLDAPGYDVDFDVPIPQTNATLKDGQAMGKFSSIEYHLIFEHKLWFSDREPFGVSISLTGKLSRGGDKTKLELR